MRPTEQLETCPDCGGLQSEVAETCPHCGRKRPTPPELAVGACLGALVGAIIGAVTGSLTLPVVGTFLGGPGGAGAGALVGAFVAMLLAAPFRIPQDQWFTKRRPRREPIQTEAPSSQRALGLGQEACDLTKAVRIALRQQGIMLAADDEEPIWPAQDRPPSRQGGPGDVAGP